MKFGPLELTPEEIEQLPVTENSPLSPERLSVGWAMTWKMGIQRFTREALESLLEKKMLVRRDDKVYLRSTFYPGLLYEPVSYDEGVVYVMFPVAFDGVCDLSHAATSLALQHIEMALIPDSKRDASPLEQYFNLHGSQYLTVGNDRPIDLVEKWLWLNKIHKVVCAPSAYKCDYLRFNVQEEEPGEKVAYVTGYTKEELRPMIGSEVTYWTNILVNI